jgi:hypothetical protein
VTSNRRGKAVIEFPNDLEIVITREFDAPLELVFDVRSCALDSTGSPS